MFWGLPLSLVIHDGEEAWYLIDTGLGVGTNTLARSVAAILVELALILVFTALPFAVGFGVLALRRLVTGGWLSRRWLWLSLVLGTVSVSPLIFLALAIGRAIA